MLVEIYHFHQIEVLRMYHPHILHYDENDKNFRHFNAVDPNIMFTQVNIVYFSYAH